MEISEQLEIIIPTYNRSRTLIKTLSCILNSPVSKCQITVLDNNSKDGTESCIKELLSKHPNLNYIKNRYNLGLAGNICKSLTIPTKKYFWIIFDDTGLDFSNWEYVEKGLELDYDCILTTNYYDVKNINNYEDKAAIYLMLIFCFAGIYKTDLITENVVLYALTDIYTVHSQMSLISALFNDENREIYIPEKTVAFPMINPETERGEEYSFNRSEISFYHFRISHTDFIPGFLQAIQSLNDSVLQKKCVELLFKKRNGVGPYSKKSVIENQFINSAQIISTESVNYLDEKFFLKNKYKLVNYRFMFLRRIVNAIKHLKIYNFLFKKIK